MVTITTPPPAERRRYERLKRRGSASCVRRWAPHDTFTLPVINISCGGMLVFSPLPLPMDDELTVIIDLKLGQRIQTRAQVVRKSPREYGCTFLDLTPESEQLIATWVASGGNLPPPLPPDVRP